MLVISGMEYGFLFMAYQYAIHINNRTFIQADETPLSLLLPKITHVSSKLSNHRLHPFGCKVVTGDDFDYDCVFIGINTQIKNSYFIDHMATGKLICSTECKFYDHIFPYQQRFTKLPPHDQQRYDQPNTAPVSPPYPMDHAGLPSSVKNNVISLDITISGSTQNLNQQSWSWTKVLNPWTKNADGISKRMN